MDRKRIGNIVDFRDTRLSFWLENTVSGSVGVAERKDNKKEVMSRTEKEELTVLCLVYNEDAYLLQDRVKEEFGMLVSYSSC